MKKKSIQNYLVPGIVLIISVTLIGIFSRSTKTPDGFLSYSDPSGKFQLAYPNTFRLLVDNKIPPQKEQNYTNELERRELNIQAIELKSLITTQEEACREFVRLNPGEKCGASVPLTQEDLQQEKIKIDTSNTDTQIESSSKFIGGTITILDGRSALYSLYYSGQAGIYYVRLSVFTDKGDLVWLEVPLWGITSLKLAQKDVRVNEFTQIISTLELSR